MTQECGESRISYISPFDDIFCNTLTAIFHFRINRSCNRDGMTIYVLEFEQNKKTHYFIGTGTENNILYLQ